MFDDEALGGQRPPSKTTEPPTPPGEPATEDDEAAAELSRAAREAVRQPPDPRLEAQFARLLGGPPAAERPAPERPAAERPATERVAERAAEPAGVRQADLAALVASVGALEARTADLERRLTLVTRLLGPVLIALVVLAVAVAVALSSLG